MYFCRVLLSVEANYYNAQLRVSLLLTATTLALYGNNSVAYYENVIIPPNVWTTIAFTVR